MQTQKPTRAEIQASAGKTIPDVIAPGLKILFCGINPGLYSAAIGHHFGRPGNRFWPTLCNAGFTPRVFSPYEDGELINLGYGITNVVARSTTAANEVTAHELLDGGRTLVEKVQRYQPSILAVLGVSAFRVAFSDASSMLGLQAQTVGGVKVWVLPNPSGLNAHYRPKDLTRLFNELRVYASQLE